jgi:hypothetical protein
MAEIVKFIYVIIIFIFQLFVLREVDGKPFLSLTNFLLYFIHNISSHFNDILFFFPFNSGFKMFKIEQICIVTLLTNRSVSNPNVNVVELIPNLDYTRNHMFFIL